MKRIGKMSSIQNPRILIVEDESKVALKYARVLENIGVSKVAGDSTQAFEQIKEFEPDVILLDLVLEGDKEYEPWESGWRILEKIKDENSLWQNIPVIVITGRIEPDVEQRCREIGVAEFFRKPIPIDALRQAVKKHTKDIVK
jgi:CheY-like chemotaxis protein